MENLQTEIINFAIVIVTALLGVATKFVTSYFNRKGILAKLDAHKELANIVVNAVEQGYKSLNGAEKFDLAKDELIKIANERGVKISEADVDHLIESAVKEMKKEYNANK